MAQISVEFDMGLPNEYMVDHSQSEGRTRRITYHGPDKIWLQLGEDGTEKYGPLTEEDIMDGRPLPEDVVEWYEVDCTTNPLICQLRAPVVAELQESYDEVPYPHPESPLVEGFDQFKVFGPPKPEDIYDKFGVRKTEDGGLEVRKLTRNEAIHGDDINLTWDVLRDKRDRFLQASDGQIAPDMPESLQEEWKAYRQALRDYPTALADVDPNIAGYMFPSQPSSATMIADRQLAREQAAAAAAGS